MIVSQFQAWARTAPAPSRADGVSALARALLYSDLSPKESRATVRALTAFLDDPSPLVRRALAEAFASAAEAPHHIVSALAEDQPGIARIVLSRSPLFSDAELVDFVASGGEAAQGAVAARPALSATVAEALADVGEPAALVTLAANFGADVSPRAIERMVARHGGDSALREALLARGRLPPSVHVELVAATASALAALVTQRAWMSGARAKRITREAAERATVAIAATGSQGADDLEAVAAGLRASGQLTVAFALRALLSDNRPLFRAILSELSGVGAERVDGLMRGCESAGFAALYRRAGLPLPLLPVFRAVLRVPRPRSTGGRADTSLSPALVRLALATCGGANDGALDKLSVLLRRFEIEAERDGARVAAAPAPTRPAFAPAVAAPAMALVRGSTGNHGLAAVTFDEAVPMGRAEPIERAVPVERAIPMAPPQPARFTIDLAAIEAELLAA